MKKVIERIVKSEGAPTSNDLWLNPVTNELKHFENEQWKSIGGSSAPKTSDLTNIPSSVLDSLEVGDRIVKKTGTARHLYTVTYKDAENGGLCLTYQDASVIETVSYDHTSDGWEYDSTDVTRQGALHVSVESVGGLSDAEKAQLLSLVESGKIHDAVIEIVEDEYTSVVVAATAEYVVICEPSSLGGGLITLELS